MAAEEVVRFVVQQLVEAEVVEPRVFSHVVLFVEVFEGMALETVLGLEPKHRPDPFDGVAEDRKGLYLVVVSSGGCDFGDAAFFFFLSLFPPPEFVEVFEGATVTHHGGTLHLWPTVIVFVGETIGEPLAAALVDAEVGNVVLGLPPQPVHTAPQELIDGRPAGLHVVEVQELVGEHLRIELSLFSHADRLETTPIVSGLLFALFLALPEKEERGWFEFLGDLDQQVFLGLFGGQQPCHARRDFASRRRRLEQIPLDETGGVEVIADVAVASVAAVEGGSRQETSHSRDRQEPERSPVFGLHRSSLRCWLGYRCCCCHGERILFQTLLAIDGKMAFRMNVR
mmetsp:Transcript_20559/g.42958  ORF Transcript_20559/g.42958 Transcript_20559/m.42958 type:complete len:341 (-) Transcript_20559:180-1202(-)